MSPSIYMQKSVTIHMQKSEQLAEAAEPSMLVRRLSYCTATVLREGEEMGESK
jgi:hypothetical protein